MWSRTLLPPPNNEHEHLKALGRTGAREGHIRLPLCKAASQVHCHLPTSVRPWHACVRQNVNCPEEGAYRIVTTKGVSSVYTKGVRKAGSTR